MATSGDKHKKDTDILLRQHLKMYPNPVKCLPICNDKCNICTMPSLRMLDVDAKESVSGLLTSTFNVGRSQMCQVMLASLSSAGFILDIFCPSGTGTGKNTTAVHNAEEAFCSQSSVAVYFWDLWFGILLTLLLVSVKAIPWFIDCSCMSHHYCKCVLCIWAFNCCCCKRKEGCVQQGVCCKMMQGCCNLLFTSCDKPFRCLVTRNHTCFGNNGHGLFHTFMAGMTATGIILVFDVLTNIKNIPLWILTIFEMFEMVLFPVSYKSFYKIYQQFNTMKAFIVEIVVCVVSLVPALILIGLHYASEYP